MPKLMKRYVAPVALSFVIGDRWQVRSGDSQEDIESRNRTGMLTSLAFGISFIM